MFKSFYIHIPFCRKRCDYCDFYSVIYERNIAGVYVEVLRQQIDKIEDKFDTIYIGGGTPSVLDELCLEKLLRALQKNRKDDCELTIEVNPESFSLSKAKLLREQGVNRLSVGVQSFSDDCLRRLGRIHNALQAKQAVALAQAAGFENISVDLIFAISGQSLEEWKEELKTAAGLGVKHISAYALTYEPSTPLSRRMQSGGFRPLDDELQALMYVQAMSYLPRQGFLQYEISNFAFSGYSCQHNCNYWDNGHCLAIGSSAVSYTGGVREKMIAGVRSYIKAVKDRGNAVSMSERLSDLDRAHEIAAFKIRTSRGIDFNWFKLRSGFDFLDLLSKAAEPLIERGYLRYRLFKGRPAGVVLTKKGFLFCDEASSAFVS